jgi:hypothetical protein
MSKEEERIWKKVQQFLENPHELVLENAVKKNMKIHQVPLHNTDINIQVIINEKTIVFTMKVTKEISNIGDAVPLLSYS